MSTKTKLSDEQIKAKLLAGNFGDSENRSSDIAPGTLTTLTVDQISFYDRNPRKEKNPEYEAIKDSIRSRGMEQTIGVTRRPDMPIDKFMVATGGNTRLEVLKELYEETGDSRFYEIQCKYIPWVSESETLVSHLIENDARGEYRFIDRVLAVIEVKNLLEGETGKTITPADLTVALEKRGYKLSRSYIYRILYTYEHLHKFIPQALEAGLGPWQVDKIQKLHNESKLLFEHVDSENDVKSYDGLFHDMLLKSDNQDANVLYDDLLFTVANEISFGDSSKIALNSKRLEMLLDGHDIDKVIIKPDDQEFEAVDNQDEENLQSNGAEYIDDDQTDLFQPDEHPRRNLFPDEDDSAQDQQNDSIPRDELGYPVEDDNAYSTSMLTDFKFKPVLRTYKSDKEKISRLRHAIYRLAYDVADSFGFAEVIIRATQHNVGVGYFISDYPNWKAEILDQNLSGDKYDHFSFEEKKIFITELFWYLVSASSVFSYPNEEAAYSKVPQEFLDPKSLLVNLHLQNTTETQEFLVNFSNPWMRLNNTAQDRHYLFLSGVDDEKTYGVDCMSSRAFKNN